MKKALKIALARSTERFNNSPNRTLEKEN